MEKVRPIAEVGTRMSSDFRDEWHEIDYFCPKCGKIINGGYKSENACDNCGTFYDWGIKAPSIKVIRTVEW